MGSALLLAACSGGGSGGGGASEGDFFITNASYGRLIVEDGVARVVSPYTTVETDPITGDLKPGTLATLSDEIEIDNLVTLGLGSAYLPRVVPRNGVLTLNFTHEIDPASVTADEVDSEGNLVSPGSIRIRHQDGAPVKVKLTVVGKDIRINPVVEGTVGLPASPIVFGPDGEARADATGFLRLIIPDSGTSIVRSVDGTPNAGRTDKLGSSSANPIGINPGNEILDFVGQSQLVFTNETFNGFLPDLTPPRIIREHRYEKALDFGSGDSATSSTVTDLAGAFNITASNGNGEWADKRLVLRPGTATEESLSISHNTVDTIVLNGTFDSSPHDGDTYRLKRAEFFEPDPDAPINPDLFDPNNPENTANARLVNFIQAYEIDATANVIGDVIDIRQTLPTFSELRVRFNEAMDSTSFKQWQTFRVAFNPDAGTKGEFVTRLLVNERQDEIRIQPVRIDQQDGSFETLGWGEGVKALQFQITTVPTVSFLQERMSSNKVQDFINMGIEGVRDLGGRPLAFPSTAFDANNPAITYSEAFFTDDAVSSFNPPPVSADWGMMVHRFLGRPTTGTDPATDLPGVKYGDHDNMYTPIADVNLQVNGRLSGQPVVFITKVHDDFYPPPDGQFGAFPLGTSTPLVHLVTTADGAPPWAHLGARFQQVFRDVDASPGRDGLAGTLLDLYRISWAPIGGNVSDDTYDDISIHTGHSHFRPITAQNGAGAVDGFYGLNEMFDYKTFEDRMHRNVTLCKETLKPEGPNHLPGAGNYVTNVPAGTSWKVSGQNLFSPPFDNNAFHPWPDFNTDATRTVFQYNNGDIPKIEKQNQKAFNDESKKQGNGKPWLDKRVLNGYDNRGGDSLMLEVRIRPQETLISGSNGFTFSPGILITPFPMFRCFSRGEFGNPLFPDDQVNDTRARCATAGTGLRGTSWGDNSRYFAVFDYVKTTSQITSPYVRVFPGNLGNPKYSPAIIDPPLDAAPLGTQILMEYEGANTSSGGKGTGFSTDIRFANGKPNVSFRVTFVGNTLTLLAPNFDTVAIPFKKQ